eukprot:gene35771-44108_t
MPMLLATHHHGDPICSSSRHARRLPDTLPSPLSRARPMTQIIEITDSAGRIVAGEWLQQAEAVHRQLRPQLMPDYLGQMQRVFAGGAQMLVAVEDGHVLGLTVWRILEKTFSRSELYIDDLVTDAGHRSAG